MEITPFLPAGSVPVLVQNVEGELSGLVKLFQGLGDMPVQRARMSNLVIFCDRRDLAETVAKEVPAVVAMHPARVLLVVGEVGADAPVTAAALVRPLEVGRLVNACAEMVTLHAGGGGIPRLAFAVRALLVGDLPINLWWACNVPPPFAGPLLYDLAENAQQILYDSRGWLEPTRAVAATASWLEGIEESLRMGRWRVASDLNWRRLKYWRRLIAQALDPAVASEVLGSAHELTIEHGPHALVEAWELASWIARQLGWEVQRGQVSPGVEIVWVFQAAHGPVQVRIRRLPKGPSEVRQVRLRCQLQGEPGSLLFRTGDARHLEAIAEGIDAAPRTITVPASSRPELVARQLSDRERDPVFLDCMAVAETLAQSLIDN